MNNLLLSRRFLLPCQRITEFIQSRFYAKPAVPVKAKKVGKGGPVVEKIVLPVERDVNKLVNYVAGSNINITGEDVMLKPESEYPDWLWELHTGPPKKLEELDPNTKAYWRKLRTMAHVDAGKVRKVKKKF